jgi:integrase
MPPGAELIDVKGIRSARFKRKGKTKTAPLTEDGKRIRVESPFWYGWVQGKAVKLFTDAVASQSRLAELLRKAERQETGIADPFEEHRKRPLVDHLSEWASNLRNRGKGASHIRATTGCVRRIIEACKFERTADFSASKIEQYLADLRTDGAPLCPLDRAKETYTKAELAAALGINKTAVASLVKRHRLEANGNGKARRYPRATVETLREKRNQGIGIKTSNLYLSGMKAFCNWLVRDGRMAANPIVHLKGLDPQNDQRHARRYLDEKELGSVIGAATKSAVEFRGLNGTDRAMIYRLACTSGFRANELASLCPKDFAQDEPIVILSSNYTKNKKPAEQPLPAEVADLLRGYLAGRPANKPVWPGTWYEVAVDMLRIDLDAAGIPYVIEGGEGPLFADFHSLRHSYVAILDKSGATLKEAMQLARHSDPKLTMKIYGKARRHDLARAADRLPSFGEKPEQAKDRKMG